MTSELLGESRSLELMLGGDVNQFFASVWQESCAVFTTYSQLQETDSGRNGRSTWDEERVRENPFRELIHHGFPVLVDIMEQRHVADHEDGNKLQEGSKNENAPLLFRDCEMLSMKDRRLYSYADDKENVDTQDKSIQLPIAMKTNLWAAFLDGCSVVINHADTYASPWLAALCTDLQESFPHAYANVYITPAQSQTVPPHADDRDVFIIQVYGRKHWTVYETIPIHLPFPDEQVGKGDASLPVPQNVLDGPILLQRTLSPGDVLYMPRGYVHEAVSCVDCCSFHVTVALATHDWSLTGLLSSISQTTLSRPIEYRKAVDRQWGRQQRQHQQQAVAAGALQKQLDQAIECLRSEFTVQNLDAILHRKYERHNQRAAILRQRLTTRAQRQDPDSSTNRNPLLFRIGRGAAAKVTLDTVLRAATDKEKQDLLLMRHQEANIQTGDNQTTTLPPPQRGLHVRSETFNFILAMIQYLKQAPQQNCALKDLPLRVGLRVRNDGLERSSGESTTISSVNDQMICDLTLLSMARRCVELGALAIVDHQ